MKSHSSLAALLVAAALALVAPRAALAQPAARPNENTVNAVLGDESFVARFGAPPGPDAPEALRLRTHLEYVERLLRAVDASALPAGLRAERARNLDRLRDYIALGRFPRNTDRPGRRPRFLDDRGNLCAVGYLVAQSAGRALAERVNREHEYDFLADIRSEALDAWAARSGLGARELAMIQPSYEFMHRDRPPPPPLPPTTAEVLERRMEATESAATACGASVLFPHALPGELTVTVRIETSGAPRVTVVERDAPEALQSCVLGAVLRHVQRLGPTADRRALLSHRTYHFAPRPPLSNPGAERFQMELDALHVREQVIPCLPPLPEGRVGSSQDVTVRLRALPRGGLELLALTATMPLPESSRRCVESVVSRAATSPFRGAPVELSRAFQYLR